MAPRPQLWFNQPYKCSSMPFSIYSNLRHPLRLNSVLHSIWASRFESVLSSWLRRFLLLFRGVFTWVVFWPHLQHTHLRTWLTWQCPGGQWSVRSDPAMEMAPPLIWGGHATRFLVPSHSHSTASEPCMARIDVILVALQIQGIFSFDLTVCF